MHRYPPSLLCVLLALALPSTSFAMQIRRVQTCSGIVLKLRGDVREGDYVRLRSHFRGKEPIIGLDLSSYGGDFEEGLRIADFARREKLTVYVSEECDSACADIFFAAVKRYFGSNSKIGVHSISNDHDLEDAESRRMTVKLARLWAKRGVPSSAIGKMITTRPDAISYLDQTDLRALDASAGILCQCSGRRSAVAGAGATPGTRYRQTGRSKCGQNGHWRRSTIGRGVSPTHVQHTPVRVQVKFTFRATPNNVGWDQITAIKSPATNRH